MSSRADRITFAPCSVSNNDKAKGMHPNELAARLSTQPGATLADGAVLESLPNRYREDCSEYCALARRCKAGAVAAGETVLLGTGATEVLAPSGSLPRALELLRGTGQGPRTPDESSLRALLQQVESNLAGVISY